MTTRGGPAHRRLPWLVALGALALPASSKAQRSAVLHLRATVVRSARIPFTEPGARPGTGSPRVVLAEGPGTPSIVMGRRPADPDEGTEPAAAAGAPSAPSRAARCSR